MEISVLNWYHRLKTVLAIRVPAYVKLAAGFETFTWAGPTGSQFFSIGGNAAWGVRPQLEGLGFRVTRGTDNDPGYWHFFIKADVITGSPELQQSLSGLGIPLGDLGIVSQQAPAPPPPQQRPAQQPQSQKVTQWFLGKSVNLPDIPAQTPVVVARSPNGGWQVMDHGGTRTNIGDKDIKRLVQSVRDKNNKPYSSADPEELFNMLNEMEAAPSTVADETKHSGRPSPEEVRIPDEWMTKYNKAIEDKFVNGVDENGNPSSIMINALAGTGKTTVLRHLSSFIEPGQKWLYLVFNKKNQVESAEKFPAGVDVLTTHAFLGKVLRMNGKDVGGDMELPSRDFKGTKIKAVADQIVDPLWPEPTMTRFNRYLKRDVCVFNWAAKSKATQIASMAKAYAVDPRSPVFMQDLGAVIEKAQIDTDLSSDRFQQPRDYTPDLLQKAAELLQASLPGQLPSGVDKQFIDMRDQDDTLWFSAINADIIRWGAKQLGYDVVLMDEVQDFNTCQLKMAEKLKQNGSRVIGVGDPNQALYYFRGADENAFEDLGSIISGEEEAMSLPINFRSGSNILDYVAQVTGVNVLSAEHNKGKGVVDIQTGYDDFMMQTANEYHENGGMMKEATAMICATNAPLTGAALTLLKGNVEFEIMGKELYRDIEKLIKQVTWHSPQNTDIYDLADALSTHADKLQEKWGHKVNKHNELKENREYTDAIISVLQYLGDNDFDDPSGGRPIKTAKDFLKFLENKIGGLDPENARDAQRIEKIDPRKVVTLTTAHKSKGLEFERVFIMHPDLFEPRDDMTSSEIKQLRNAYYVALTRAMKTLHVSADSR